MEKFKRIIVILCIMVLVFGCMSLNAFATIIPEVEATEAQGVNMQKLSIESYSELPAQEFLDLEDLEQSKTVFSGIQNKAFSSRGAWAIQDSVFVGNGNLTDSYDFYVVNLTAKQLAFLKLDSSNPNLLAVLYTINNGSLGSSTGWGVTANSGASFINVPAGQYAILIGSASGAEVGNYKLMWNCSNPSGASAILNYTDDLSRVVLYYSNSQIMSNGTNIIDGLKWEDHETWYLPLGYSARDMSISVASNNGVKGVYLGSFSSSAPYSAPNALLIDVNRGSWLYSNSYYKNDTGNVTHVIDYFDLSGLKTPRTFGDGYADFSYGPNYIIIDLDTFQVCDFLSPFNYHYTTEGGRSYSLTNLMGVS